MSPLWLIHWCNANGVPGNLAASAITGTLAVTAGYFRVWKRHIRPHIDRTAEIHRHLNPDDPFTLGGDDGTSGPGR